MRLKKFNEFMLLTDKEIDNIFYEAKTYILENNLVENDYHNNEHMINVFNNSMSLFNHYKDEYKLPPYHKLLLGLAALFHDFDHSGGRLKDSENIELALVALKEFLVTINKSDLYDDIKNIMGIFDPAQLGQGNISGKALNGQQQQVDLTNYDYYDNLTRSIAHVGKICLDYGRGKKI
jgi:hypothetical protein